MKHKINPAIDCVFKAILGNEKHKKLLIHFLNSVLELHEIPGKKIMDVRIINPYNEKEFEEDKLSVVDVKAKDASNCYYQIEIQNNILPNLSPRMLYTWSAIYHSQLGEGDDFALLTPVISIWILDGVLSDTTAGACHLTFCAYDTRSMAILSDHFAIHVLQLPKWERTKDTVSEKDRWIYLFKEGKNIDIENPPDIINQSEEMEEVMGILSGFSENQKNYLLYQSRLDSERVRLTWQREIERIKESLQKGQKELEKNQKELEKQRKKKETLQKEKVKAQKEKVKAQKEKETLQKEKERAQKEKVKAQKEKEYALKEVERLKKLLKGSEIK